MYSPQHSVEQQRALLIWINKVRVDASSEATAQSFDVAIWTSIERLRFNAISERRGHTLAPAEGPITAAATLSTRVEVRCQENGD